MVEMDGWLRSRWAATVARWGGGPAAEDAGGDVLHRYREVHRTYHTTEHLAEALAALDWLCPLAAPEHAPAAELAVWLHDVVYDPAAPPGTNEDASAGYARRVLPGLGVPPAVVGEVARLVITTADHRVAAGDVAGAVVNDADLWILGAPADRYRRYTSAVRLEYGFLDDETWHRGRADVLRGLLSRPRLYVTERARAGLEAGARTNLAWELATLGGGEPQP